jgi:hypothetical protein
MCWNWHMRVCANIEAQARRAAEQGKTEGLIPAWPGARS